jgi:uncharacterized membrane protein
MSGRDWRTIGVDAPRERAPLPPWIGWAIPPLAAPLGVIAWIDMRWQRIPLRYATHFGPPSRSTGWTTRTPLHVYGPLIFAEGMVALFLAMALIAWYGSRRSDARSPMATVLLAVMYLLSLVFTGLGLTPVAQIPAWTVALLVPVAVLSLLVYVALKESEPDKRVDAAPEECWRLGGIYYNPKDPSMFVRARLGMGYTLNMANRWSYGFLITPFAGMVALVAFLLWSQK